MIKKIILITFTLVTVSYASVDATISNQSTLVNAEQKTYQAFPAEITNNVSDESCADGKCLTDDGPLPRLVKKVSKNVKRFCKKL